VGIELTVSITAGGGHSWVADNDAMWAFFAAYVRSSQQASALGLKQREAR
jgi:hypothetical protein